MRTYEIVTQGIKTIITRERDRDAAAVLDQPTLWGSRVFRITDDGRRLQIAHPRSDASCGVGHLHAGASGWAHNEPDATL